MGGSGKDLVCEIFRRCGLRYTASTSLMARNLVWDAWGQWHYGTPDECYCDRRNHREKWHQIILDCNEVDPVNFYRYCLEEPPQDILCGVRDDKEMRAIKKAKLVDYWIWVDRPGTPVDPTMKFGPEECDWTIENDGTVGDLVEKIEALWEMILAIHPDSRD